MTRRFLVALALFAASPAIAQNVTLVHQGMLLDAADQPVSATVSMRFRIYKNATPPASSADGTWWESNPVNVTVMRGLYAVTLGQFSSGTGDLPATVFEGAGDRWLGVEVGGSPLMPRLAISSVPYASHALVADDAKRAAKADLATNATTADALGSACVGCVKASAIGDGQVTLGKLSLESGRMAGLGADTLDGLDSLDFATEGHDHDTRYLRHDTGGTLDGPLTLAGAPTAPQHAATKAYVDSATPNLTGYLKADGSIPVTGSLLLQKAPTANDHAATKAYVDGITSNLARRDGTVQAGGILDFGANGQLRLGTGGALVIDGVTLDAALLRKLIELSSAIAQTPADARASCAAIKAANPLSRNDFYYVNPGGSGAIQVYCDMTAADGPWTLVARIKKADGQAHWNTAAVGAGSPQFKGANTRKFSDTTINALRAASPYAGSTGYRFTCFEDSSSVVSGCTEQTMYCSRACSFNATASINSNECARCSKAFEGSLTQLAPNTGTRGLGHHHLDKNWFAYQRHPEEGTNSGCRSDACDGGDGTLWIR